MRNLDVWYARIDVEDVLREFSAMATTEERKRAEKNLEKTKTKDSLKAFSKLTEVVDGERRIISDPPLLVPIAELVGPGRADDVTETFAGPDPPVPARRSPATAGACSSASASSTPPARWSVSAVSAPAPGWC